MSLLDSVKDYGKQKFKQLFAGIKWKIILAVVIAAVLFVAILFGISIIAAIAGTNENTEGYNNMTGVYGGTVQEKVWFSLRELGLSEYAVAGVMGNIEGESGFNPNRIEEATGEGIGLCQWSFGRKTQLQNYSVSKGVEWTDVDTQIEFLIGEISRNGGAAGYASFQMSGTYYGYTYDSWCNANNTDTATEAFMAVFERPNMEVAHTETRKQAAQKFYNEFHGKTYSANGDATNNGDIITMKNSSTYGQGQIWNGGGQCFGFVNAVTKEYYGTECDVWDFSNGTNTHTKAGKGWTKTDDVNAVDYLKPGDSIRYHRSSTNNVGHSAWVIAVNGETITLAEANYRSPNEIDWTRTITKTEIKNDHFDYICVAPYAIGEK